ncbi:hypothetical protein PHLGIDRAFT_234090 [Phlebiopsis gigantea 11061_1 CR5-6]|uniref:Uncharacterized protein n=1 Tax=Phlebiopsis gigantea (strain 11061_1 CR5-6) TaxID=745531 RepID=A0A0C3RSX4_PHLG1|nr:hypothetical protein PHLGIDRAFT_234090 [Phlebiopsis gigantea 11061_1 CR5-6]
MTTPTATRHQRHPEDSMWMYKSLALGGAQAPSSQTHLHVAAAGVPPRLLGLCFLSATYGRAGGFSSFHHLLCYLASACWCASSSAAALAFGA